MIFRKEYDRLALRGMRFDCIIGILDHERTTPQPVELDVVLHFHMRRAAHEGQITHTIDYGRVVGELQFILVAARFLLLESAAEAIAAWLLMPPSLDVPRPQVEEVEVKLAKPRALAGRAVPEIAIRRQRGDFPPNLEVKPFGFVDVVFESPECGVYRERISPRTVLPTHVHRHLDEMELTLGSGLLLQGAPVAAGVAHEWPRNHPHRWENPTDVEQSFLCVDRPKFIHTDEVEVDVPVGELVRTKPESYF
jgi:dihydroneopterin aldolase